MTRNRRRDEIVIASIINEFNIPRKIRVRDRKRSVAAMLAGWGAGWDGDPGGYRRIMPRLEAEYGKWLVQEAWRRWNRWRDEEGAARGRLDDTRERLGGFSIGDGEPSSDEENAAYAEYEAAVRRARRWLPLDDSDPLGDK